MARRGPAGQAKVWRGTAWPGGSWPPVQNGMTGSCWLTKDSQAGAVRDGASLMGLDESYQAALGWAMPCHAMPRAAMPGPASPCRALPCQGHATCLVASLSRTHLRSRGSDHPRRGYARSRWHTRGLSERQAGHERDLDPRKIPRRRPKTA
jgi:hypothetical protein